MLLLTLKIWGYSQVAMCIGKSDGHSKDRRHGRCPVGNLHNLGPNVAAMFRGEGLSDIVRKQLLDDKPPDVFIAVESFLNHMSRVDIGGELNDVASVSENEYLV
jgi:hypothetical protein